MLSGELLFQLLKVRFQVSFASSESVDLLLLHIALLLCLLLVLFDLVLQIINGAIFILDFFLKLRDGLLQLWVVWFGGGWRYGRFLTLLSNVKFRLQLFDFFIELLDLIFERLLLIVECFFLWLHSSGNLSFFDKEFVDLLLKVLLLILGLRALEFEPSERFVAAFNIAYKLSNYLGQLWLCQFLFRDYAPRFKSRILFIFLPLLLRKPRLLKLLLLLHLVQLLSKLVDLWVLFLDLSNKFRNYLLLQFLLCDSFPILALIRPQVFVLEVLLALSLSLRIKLRL